MNTSRALCRAEIAAFDGVLVIWVGPGPTSGVKKMSDFLPLTLSIMGAPVLAEKGHVRALVLRVGAFNPGVTVPTVPGALFVLTPPVKPTFPVVGPDWLVIGAAVVRPTCGAVLVGEAGVDVTGVAAPVGVPAP
jgi:hypothetical protein